jgi:hypothetical protein
VSDGGNAFQLPPRITFANVGHWIALTAVLLTSFLAGTADAQQIPVEYRIERIPVADKSVVNDINNLSMVVGYHEPNEPGLRVGYIYDHLGIVGAPKTVHALDEWITDLDGSPEASCLGINDAGQVVGYLNYIVDDNTMGRKGFILDLDIFSATPTPTWQYLPAPPNSTDFYGRRINNVGDVIVPFKQDDTYRAYLFNPNNFDPNDPTTNYDVLTDPVTGVPLSLDNYLVTLNSSRQVVGIQLSGGPFRLTPGVRLESLPLGWEPLSINDSGTIAGTARAEIATGKGKKTQTINVAARIDAQGNVQVLAGQRSFSTDINHSGDILITTQQYSLPEVPYVYHSETNGNAGHGLLNLDDLVFGVTEDITFWFEADAIAGSAMNNRDATGFGQVVVNAWVSTTTGNRKNRVTTKEYRKFLLTPVLLP